MVSAWVYVGLALLIVFSAGVFVGALVGYPGDHRRGGTVDLSRGAARGELDLDWNDPRARRGLAASADRYANAMIAYTPETIRSFIANDGNFSGDERPRFVATASSAEALTEPDRRPSFGV